MDKGEFQAYIAGQEDNIFRVFQDLDANRTGQVDDHELLLAMKCAICSPALPPPCARAHAHTHARTHACTHARMHARYSLRSSLWNTWILNLGLLLGALRDVSGRAADQWPLRSGMPARV